MNNIDLKIVDNFLNECHKKIKNNPNLYINSKNDTVTIGLPTELLEFANRAAGHSGLNNGARPTGIRIKTANAIMLRDEILNSSDAYIDFIKKNADDGYYNDVKAEHNEYIINGGLCKKNNKPVEGNAHILVEKYGKKIFVECSKQSSKDEVINDRKTMSISEFEEKYQLSS